MCSHKALTRWHLFWRRLLTVYAVGFLAPEIYGLLTVGPDATCSAFFWHSLGTKESCRHTSLGRIVIVSVGLWLIAHLGFGKLGAAPPRKRRRIPMSH